MKPLKFSLLVSATFLCLNLNSQINSILNFEKTDNTVKTSIDDKTLNSEIKKLDEYIELIDLKYSESIKSTQAKYDRLVSSLGDINADNAEVFQKYFDESLQLIDSLTNGQKQIIKSIQIRRDSIFSLKKSRWMPARNSRQAEFLFDAGMNEAEIQSLRNSIFTFDPGQDAASLYNELISDYLGMGRLSIGTQIGQTTDSQNKDVELVQKDNAIQRLLGGGGNVIMKYAIPVFDSWGPKKRARSFIILQPSIYLDVPNIGNGVSELASQYNIAAEGYFYITGRQKKFNLFGNGKFSYSRGNDDFRSNLGLDKDSLILGFYSLGISISEKIRLSFTKNFTTKSGIDLGNTIAFSLIP